MPITKTNPKLKIKKGDTVLVIAGRDKGKRGEVTKVLPAENRVMVAGVNQVTKHTRATPMSAGGILTIGQTIHVSNVAHIDPKTDKPTRIGYQMKDGAKIRVARKSGEALDK